MMEFLDRHDIVFNIIRALSIATKQFRDSNQLRRLEMFLLRKTPALYNMRSKSIFDPVH